MTPSLQNELLFSGPLMRLASLLLLASSSSKGILTKFSGSSYRRSRQFCTSMSDFTATDMGESDRAKDLHANLSGVQMKVAEAVVAAERVDGSVTLIAVGKTKPASDVLALYEAGHRDFGENYFQELVTKAEELPKDIRWHFIGHLQSQKAGPIVKGVPNLACVETVDSTKLAGKLNTAAGTYRAEGNKLNICLQVDTSGEASKSGVPCSEVAALALYVKDSCPNLHVLGLMTIGAPRDFTCFDRLVEARADVAVTLGVEPETLELSMGMSGDFVEAIARGSTRVRVGSTLFGARDYREKA